MGSPLIRNFAPRGFAAATFAPALLRSSPTTKSKSEICSAGVEKFFCGGNHRGDDSLRIAGTASPNEFGVFDRGKKRRDSIHVRRKRDDRLAPARKYIVAIWLDRDVFEAAGCTRCQERQLREEEVRHVLLTIGRRLDIDERARKFEKIHSDRLFLEGTIRKEGTAKKCSGLLPLDSAPSGFSSGRKAMRPSKRMTVDRP